MKKLFILLTILGLGVSAFSFEYDSSAKLSPSKQMQKSYEEQNEICFDIARNFRYDSNFSAYIRNLCHLYTADRERVLGILFPSNNKVYSDGTNSREEMAKFAIERDNSQAEYYRTVAEQYCRFNNNRLAKKDPKACDRLEKLFYK